MRAAGDWRHESALEAQSARCHGPARDSPPRRAAGARDAGALRTFAAKVPARTSDVAGRPWVEPLPRQFDAGKYCAAADRIIAGEFDVFALRPAQLGFPPQWNRDPKTGRVAPLTFGKALELSGRADRRRYQVPVGAEPSRGAADARAGVAFVAGPALRRRLSYAARTHGSSSVRTRAARIGAAASSTRCA